MDNYIDMVNQSGGALKYVPNDKRTDEICKIAVNQNGFALAICTKR